MTGMVDGIPTSTVTRRSALLLTAGVVAVSSASFTMIKVVLRSLSPTSLAAGRVTFSACLFCIVVVAQPRRRSPIVGPDRWKVVVCGVGASAGFHVLYSWGQSRVSVAVSAVVLGAMPAIVALGEVVFLGHRLSLRQIGGLVVTVLGIVVISVGGASGGSTGESASSVLGIAAVAAATIVWSAVTVGTRSLAGRYDGWWLNVPGTVIGAFLMLAIAAPRWREFADLPALSWVYVVWLGAAGSAFIYAGLATAMKVLSATTTASLLTLVTPISIVIAWIALSERPGAAAVTGAIAVVLGVVLVSELSPSPRVEAEVSA